MSLPPLTTDHLIDAAGLVAVALCAWAGWRLARWGVNRRDVSRTAPRRHG
jgi:hypothetical protein